MKLQELFEKTFPLILTLNEENWDQCEGDKCLGYHLGNVLYVPPLFWRETLDKIGQKSAAYCAECSVRELDAILHACGAPFHPFGTAYWKNPIVDVWNRMKTMQERPPFSLDPFVQKRYINEHHTRFGICVT